MQTFQADLRKPLPFAAWNNAPRLVRKNYTFGKKKNDSLPHFCHKTGENTPEFPFS